MAGLMANLRWASVRAAGIQPQHGARRLLLEQPAFGLLPSCVPPGSSVGKQRHRHPVLRCATLFPAFLPLLVCIASFALLLGLCLVAQQDVSAPLVTMRAFIRHAVLKAATAIRANPPTLAACCTHFPFLRCLVHGLDCFAKAFISRCNKDSCHLNLHPAQQAGQAGQPPAAHYPGR